ncbi:MAG: RkpR, polysaccharide export protein [Roseibium sp.]|uniref:RkpR, polysaccharide export protein n=1 Tax=Roseibium sp. TaxID=1936156 RepID=UPI00262A03F8|nr:RkpR, polysaccharide export protein [Roseibium sp.]MCV0428446.1 RkpR, polysaccharide export protein [Roseibium sp.]
MSAETQLDEDAAKNKRSEDVIPLKRELKSSKPAKDHSLLDRLKRAGLDPHKLLDLTLQNGSGQTKRSKRHWYVRASLLLTVLLPSLFVSYYMFFVASDQYHSTTAFAIRSSNMPATSEILGMVLSSGADSTTSNSYIVHDYLQSQAVLDDIKRSVDINSVFNREGSDWFFRMGENLPVEDQLDYWNSMVDVSYDATSSVIYVEVRSFNPEDSVAIASEVLNRSEILVNKLSDANRRQSVRYAEETIARAEARLKAIRRQLLDYREKTQEVSPEENARLAAEMIAGLEQNVVSKEAERTTLLSYLNEDSPRIRILTEEISALKQQVQAERKRLGSGRSTQEPAAGTTALDRSTISFRIADYSDLKLEEEFANQLYVTSLASLEQARQEADQKHMYLATFIQPTLSEDAQYPRRILSSIAFFLLALGIWVTVVLMIYNIRDRS